MDGHQTFMWIGQCTAELHQLPVLLRDVKVLRHAKVTWSNKERQT